MKSFLLTTIGFIAMAITCNAQWTTSGTNAYFSLTGNVGIGTTNPYKRLNIQGNMSVTTVDFNASGTGSALVLGQDGTSGNVYSLIQAAINGSNTGGVLTINPNGGNVGIGTTSPNGALDVNGAILVPGSTTNTMTRPAVGIARITGEIAGYRGANLAYDDGFLRLSAGGGTNTIAKTYIDLSGYSTVPDMDRNITLGTEAIERMRITNSGNVGIGTTNPDSKLAVNGTIHSKEVKVDLTGWADYVFKPNYQLPSLSAVKVYIDQNHHLPEIPSEQEIAKDGLNLGEMNRLLVKKVEELTLYLINEHEQLKQSKIKNEMLENKLNNQQDQINQILTLLKASVKN